MNKLFKWFFLLAVLITSESVRAQVVEINPAVQWKYVRSQVVELQNKSVYQYEFPAEKGFDYIFNVTISESNIETFVRIYDLQMKPIAGDDATTEQLNFRVPASGTYIVTLGYQGPEGGNGKTPIDIRLIRREIVED
ncbi:MAG: hypothetical protein ACJA19_001062 [Bacteroidia bacterium]|jgi:hypothetical protein|tara:strand:- start:3619 stop:4029 length:411 start_codon:yes stop_codon:yes gene_type:complete